MPRCTVVCFDSSRVVISMALCRKTWKIQPVHKMGHMNLCSSWSCCKKKPNGRRKSSSQGSEQPETSSGNHVPHKDILIKKDQFLKECVWHQGPWRLSWCNQIGQPQGRMDRMENSSLSWVTISENLVPNIESSFFQITSVEIAQHNSTPCGCASQNGWIMPKPPRNMPWGKFRFKTDIDLKEAVFSNSLDDHDLDK